jgi:hypothetical protein
VRSGKCGFFPGAQGWQVSGSRESEELEAQTRSARSGGGGW